MKTIIKIFICLSLIYTPIFANAANVGGWNLSNAVAQGASTVYDATKNTIINGKDFVKNSWVKITPNATQVAKVLARGGAGYALSVAVEQLLGAVDWVLDPANNRIKYTEILPPNPNQPWNQYNYRTAGLQTTLSSTAQASCSKWADSRLAYLKSQSGYTNEAVSLISCPSPSFNDSSKQAVIQLSYVHNSQVINYQEKAQILALINPSYDGTQADEEEKYLPLPVVAEKVISNAAGGDASAQQATTAAAADIVAEAEKDYAKARPIASQAEANAETKPADEAEAEKANEAQGQSKPNEANPEATDISLELPKFCSWAPTICEAAQVVISFPNTLSGWYTDTKTKAEEWATSITEAYHDFLKDDELPNDDTKVDITDIPTPELQENAISWGASCPADVSIPISMQGVYSTLVFSWSPWCQLLSIIKPAIIASAYIGAAFIVLGIRT